MNEEREELFFPPQDTFARELQWLEDFPAPLFCPVPEEAAAYPASHALVGEHHGHDEPQYLHMAQHQQHFLPTPTPPSTPSTPSLHLHMATNQKRKATNQFIDIALNSSLHEDEDEDAGGRKINTTAECALPKSRLRWTPQLHDRFIAAVNYLGGRDKATPKTILRMMKIPGLTIFHVKSHLQKYRISSNKLDQSLQTSARERGSKISTTEGGDLPQDDQEQRRRGCGSTEEGEKGKTSRAVSAKRGSWDNNRCLHMEKDLQCQLNGQRNLSSIVSKLGSHRSSESEDNTRACAQKLLELYKKKQLSSKAAAVIETLTRHSDDGGVESLVEGWVELGSHMNSLLGR